MGVLKVKNSNQDDIVVSIPRIQSALNLFMNVILMCYCHFQTYEHCHIFKGFINHFHIAIVSCILVVRQAHIFSHI
jgi:hypothetical protein